MADIVIPAPDGALNAYLATPDGNGPWPGVVVIHDALGMRRDTRQQAEWWRYDGENDPQILAAVEELRLANRSRYAADTVER